MKNTTFRKAFSLIKIV